MMNEFPFTSFARAAIHMIPLRQALDLTASGLSILLCFSGSGRWLTEKREDELQAGHILIARDFGPLTLLNTGGGEMRLGTIQTADTVFWRPGSWLYTGECAAGDFDTLRQAFSLLLNECDTGKSGAQRICENAMEIIRFCLVRQFPLIQPSSPMGGHRYVQAVKNAVLNQYDGALSLQTLAAELGVSTPYLSALFRKETGVTFSAFLQNTRIQKAMRLLRDTDELILDIALMCGFGGAPHFNKAFRTHTGLAPQQYRRRSRGKDGDDAGMAFG